jgi:hypothetical protein
VRQTQAELAEPCVSSKLTQAWLDTHAPPTVVPPDEAGDQKQGNKEQLVTKQLVEQLRKLGATTDDEALTTVQAVEELIAKHEEASSSPELTASDYQRLRSLRHSLHRCSVEHRLKQAWQRLHPEEEPAARNETTTGWKILTLDEEAPRRQAVKAYDEALGTDGFWESNIRQV